MAPSPPEPLGGLSCPVDPLGPAQPRSSGGFLRCLEPPRDRGHLEGRRKARQGVRTAALISTWAWTHSPASPSCLALQRRPFQHPRPTTPQRDTVTSEASPRDPLTRESSVSFGSFGASVAHAPSGAYVAHESWLPSGPFRTSRMLRTRGAGVDGGLWPSLASVPERSPPSSRDTRVTFFSREPEHARPALGPGVPDPSFGPGVSGGSWTPLIAFASGKSCRPGWPRGPSITCRCPSGER